VQLPAGSTVHPVFHVSQLRRVLRPDQQVSLNLPSSTEEFPTPAKVLDRRWRRKGNKSVEQVLTQWSNGTPAAHKKRGCEQRLFVGRRVLSTR